MELREKIAKLLYIKRYMETGIIAKPFEKAAPYEQGNYLNSADQILALIEESGYVKLAENQELPEHPEVINESHRWYVQGQKDMAKAGWRKIGI